MSPTFCVLTCVYDGFLLSTWQLSISLIGALPVLTSLGVLGGFLLADVIANTCQPNVDCDGGLI